MKDIVLDLKGSYVTDEEMESIKPEIMEAQKTLLERSGVSSDMTGWIDFIDNFDNKVLEEIKAAGNYIKNNCDAFILLGIGGSYLGARAVIEAVRGNFHNELSSPQIYYAGQNLSGSYLKRLIEVIKNKKVCLIVISKSGTTLETALSFRILRDLMEERYKEDSINRIFLFSTRRSEATVV